MGATPTDDPRYGIRVDKQYFNFGSAHFLLFADGTREELHGHNYHVTVDLEGHLGDGDLVVDFIPLKPMVKAICDSLDHTTLLPTESPRLQVTTGEHEVEARFGADRFVFPRRDVTLIPLTNTSTECLARYIAGRLADQLAERFPDASISKLRISVSESPGQAGWYECQLP